MVRYLDVDGHSVAWSVVGSGPILVYANWWPSHLEILWRDAEFRAAISMLAEHRSVVLYDRIGMGMSDRGAPLALDLATEVRTLAAVIDAQGPGPVDLFGPSSGGPIAATYAAEHPDSVANLVLWASYTRGSSVSSPTVRASLLDLFDQDWILGSRLFADTIFPHFSISDRRLFAKFLRLATSRENGRAALQALFDADVSSVLPRIAVPTRVIHRRDDTAIRVALGRELAAAIPGAEFVELPGVDHMSWQGNARELHEAILEFLGVPVAPRGQTAAPTLAGLSERELEILRLIARGMTDQQIADRLVLSVHTVHRHVANIRTKTGANSRAAAIAWASEHKLLT